MSVSAAQSGHNWAGDMPSWLSSALRSRQSTAGIPPDTPLQQLPYVVIDTELTSLDSRSNRVLSIGAIAMNGSRILLGDQFYRIVNPGVSVPATGVLIHKLRPHDVEQGEAPGAVMSALQ